MQTITQDTLILGLWAMLIMAVVILGKRLPHPKRVIVKDWQIALHLRKGVALKLLPPGASWIWAPGDELDVYDGRLTVQTLPAQEVLTADQIQVKVSLALSFRVKDALRLRSTAKSYTDQLYLRVQWALRQALGALNLEEVLANRQSLDSGLLALLKPQAEALGLELEALGIKDIMLPAELKQAFAAELRARKEGLAKLEQARAESAVLRNLANQAQLLKSSPELLQLRHLQLLEKAASNGSGNQLIVGLDPLKRVQA